MAAGVSMCSWHWDPQKPHRLLESAPDPVSGLPGAALMVSAGKAEAESIEAIEACVEPQGQGVPGWLSFSWRIQLVQLHGLR